MANIVTYKLKGQAKRATFYSITEAHKFKALIAKNSYVTEITLETK